MTWADVAFATGPGDRAEAEAGVREGLMPPPGGPRPRRSCGRAPRRRLGGGGDPPRRRGRGRRAEQGRPGVAHPVGGGVAGPAARSIPSAKRCAPSPGSGPGEDMAARDRPRSGGRACGSPPGGLLWPRVNTVVQEIRRGLSVLGGEEAGDLLRQAALDAVLGQHDAAWLSAFDDAPGLAGLARVSRHAGWWFPYADVAIVCERPAELHLDERGPPPPLRRPGAGLPRRVRAGGLARHAGARGLRGVDGRPDPRAHPRTRRTPSLRRVMLEHFGFDRYLSESGATSVHQDETGVLWRIQPARRRRRGDGRGGQLDRRARRHVPDLLPAGAAVGAAGPAGRGVDVRGERGALPAEKET